MAYRIDINIGLGLQVLDIDLTGSDATLLASLKSAEFILLADETEEVVEQNEVAYPPTLAAASGLENQFHTASVQTALGSEDRTYLRLVFEMTERGVYYLSLALTDTDDRKTVAQQSIVIGVGDGLPPGAPKIV